MPAFLMYTPIGELLTFAVGGVGAMLTLVVVLFAYAKS
jgi:hypothetical protein